MGMFIWLILLLMIAWGLADYQLRDQDKPTPPPPIKKVVKAKPASSAAPAITTSPDSTAQSTAQPASDSVAQSSGEATNIVTHDPNDAASSTASNPSAPGTDQ